MRGEIQIDACKGIAKFNEGRDGAAVKRKPSADHELPASDGLWVDRGKSADDPPLSVSNYISFEVCRRVGGESLGHQNRPFSFRSRESR